MQIFEDLKQLPDEARGNVIAIGNFDGVHKGHQELLKITHDVAREKNLKTGVLTFEPHPRHLFRPDDPPFRITPLPVKARRLETYEIDYMFAVEFNWDFASQTAEQFIDEVLKSALQPAHVVIGYDFRFGQLRKGTPETLKAAGQKVTIVDKLHNDAGEAYSSSNIRQALRHGELEKANELLGWDWEMQGIIVKGDQRGRELGYPTANVPLEETLHPSYGVYACLVKIVEDGPDAPWLPAATNIGIRPMFQLDIGQVEAHILNFDRDIYGKTLRIKPAQKLRGEARFEDLDALTAQMEKDCQRTRELLD